MQRAREREDATPGGARVRWWARKVLALDQAAYDGQLRFWRDELAPQLAALARHLGRGAGDIDAMLRLGRELGVPRDEELRELELAKLQPKWQTAAERMHDAAGALHDAADGMFELRHTSARGEQHAAPDQP